MFSSNICEYPVFFWLFAIIYLFIASDHIKDFGNPMGSKDRTFTCTGFCFVKYATSGEADRAIAALHNQHTLPGVSKLFLYVVCTVLLVYLSHS